MSKVMVSLPTELLHAIDEVAAEDQRSRSSVLAERARLYLHLRVGRVPRRERPEVQAAIASIDRLARGDHAGDRDGTHVIRTYRERRR